MTTRADILLTRARVRTMDPARPTAEAVAIGGGRILAVGDAEDLAPLAGPRTRTYDLEGRTVLPGFFDSHFHYYQWALGRLELPLDRAASFAQCMDMVRQAAEKAAPHWIVGQGFNESDWPENRMPVREDLDAAAPGRPALLWRCDLHLAVASSAALAAAGLTDDSPDPKGGVLERDAYGRLTGVLREGAINLVKTAAPSPTLEELVDVMDEAQGELHSLGVTAVHDVRLAGCQSESALTLAAWQRLREEDRLRLRVWAGLPGEQRAQAAALGLRTGLGDDLLRIGHLKYFLDGGMGARTAWMLAPYLDHGGHGLNLIPPDKLRHELNAAHDAGLATMIHAIGDAAARELITAHEESARRKTPGPALAHRMEHAQVIRQDDIVRLAALGIPVSAQPANLVLDINMIDQCYGGLGRHAYPFRSLLDAGVPLLFSSDCPVCAPNPLEFVRAAVTRARRDGTPAGGWHPEQLVTLDEALQACTLGPARAYGLEDRMGVLRPGAYADIAVLDRDIHARHPQELAETRVALTIFDGRVVHDAA